MRRAALLAAALTLVVAGAAWRGAPRTVVVQPGEPVAAAAAHADRILLGAGTHAGFTLTRGVEVVGAPDTLVAGEVRVTADGAVLRDLRVRSSGNAVTIREADGVVVENLTVESAGAHGIEVIDASARITRCAVSPRGEYAQGIEIRNTNGRPRTIVERCRIDGGYEGIVSHVSRVELRDNVVTGTAPRAIAITEMSEGVAERNVVHDAAGVAFWCGDFSHCEIRDNVVRGIRDTGIGAKTENGRAILAFYYSTMRARRNTISGAEAAEPVAALVGSTTTDRFPPALWPAGWRAALPGIAGASAAGAGAAAILAAAAWPLARRRRARPAITRSLARSSAGAWLAAFTIQSFHMAEHAIQVYQVHVADAKERRGLLGAHVDSEWLHLAWNLLVFAFLIWTIALLRRLPGTGAFGPVAALAAIGLQGWHVVEHVAKVVQHAATGLTPAPGVAGGTAGLVWFHYAINLGVWLLIAVAAADITRSFTERARIWPGVRAHSGQKRVSALASPGTPG